MIIINTVERTCFIQILFKLYTLFLFHMKNIYYFCVQQVGRDLWVAKSIFSSIDVLVFCVCLVCLRKQLVTKFKVYSYKTCYVFFKIKEMISLLSINIFTSSLFLFKLIYQNKNSKVF